MNIQSHTVVTNSGKVSRYFGHPLNYLSDAEKKELDVIGYTGKNSAGVRTNWEEYLNSLRKGQFKVKQTKWDNGEFTEEFEVTRVHTGFTLVFIKNEKEVECNIEPEKDRTILSIVREVITNELDGLGTFGLYDSHGNLILTEEDLDNE